MDQATPWSFVLPMNAARDDLQWVQACATPQETTYNKSRFESEKGNPITVAALSGDGSLVCKGAVYGEGISSARS